MSKNNKKIAFVIAITFLFTFCFASKVKASDNISGTVHNEMVATFAKKDTSQKTLDSIKKIAYDDSNVNVLVSSDNITVTENLGTSNNVDLKINNKNVKVNNGHFSVNLNKAKSFRYQVTDSGIAGKNTVAKATTDKHINLVDQVSYSTMIKNMDSMNNMDTKATNQQSNLLSKLDSMLILQVHASTTRYSGQKNGQKVKKGTHVHCNRFNGIHSNHRYYSRLKAQGWVNYYKSDCWYKHKAYKCPFTRADKKCDGLLKHKAHNCSTKGHWSVTCWYRNK